MKTFPSYVDLEFSARCNLKCGFCFGPVDNPSIPDIGFEFWADLLGALSSRGCIGIVISGGEPTLYPHLRDLLARAKSLGLKTVLSTHGRHENRLMEVLKFCDWIALPVDGAIPESLRTLRGDGWGLKEAVALARKLKIHSGNSVRIKLGTVATRKNCADVILLAGDILTLPEIPFDTWKIYQYTPRRKFAGQREIYEISDDTFNALSIDVWKTGVCERINTVFSSCSLRRRAYLFVYPDGTLAIPNEGDDFSDIKIGNVATEGLGVLDCVGDYSLFSNCGNFEATYG